MVKLMRNILTQGAQQLGIRLPSEAPDKFRLYYDFLEEKNQVMNLTAISGEKDVAELHFLDSLALLTLDSFEKKSVIDIGSGAGFPGIPLKLAVPTLRLTMLDAQLKRIRFLEELCDTLCLKDVSPIHARAEETAHTDLRETFDYAVSRAVARLNILAELCLPFVKEGGVFIAMKGMESDKEITEADSAIKTLGAELDKISDYQIPGTDLLHRAVMIRKTAPTPGAYPRRFARIEKKPL